jgi:hypothetical protein
MLLSTGRTVEMSRTTRLTKSEVNAHYYNTVGGAIVFGTEAQSNVHPLAVARLLAAQARSMGKRQLRIMEIGAASCAFATGLLTLLEDLTAEGETNLDQVDYFAVEYAESALETALRTSERDGSFEQIRRFPPPAGPTEMALIGSLVNEGTLRVNLYLLHADANRCVANSTGTFDVVILNELLDDLPYRAFYADAEGTRHELTAHAELDNAAWVATVGADELSPGAGGPELPPGTLTATSEEALTLVRGISSLLESGGLLLIHDYGFAEPYVAAAQYENPPRALPPFARMEFPDGSGPGFPRSFFRVFGNEAANAIQITNDVNFAELTAVLEASGTVITMPHGNSLFAKNPSVDALEKGDGVFLSEFVRLGLHDDLPGLLGDLHRKQGELRERYAREYSGGVAAVFNDLIFVKR